MRTKGQQKNSTKPLKNNKKRKKYFQKWGGKKGGQSSRGYGPITKDRRQPTGIRTPKKVKKNPRKLWKKCRRRAKKWGWRAQRERTKWSRYQCVFITFHHKNTTNKNKIKKQKKKQSFEKKKRNARFFRTTPRIGVKLPFWLPHFVRPFSVFSSSFGPFFLHIPSDLFFYVCCFCGPTGRRKQHRFFRWIRCLGLFCAPLF